MANPLVFKEVPVKTIISHHSKPTRRTKVKMTDSPRMPVNFFYTGGRSINWYKVLENHQGACHKYIHIKEYTLPMCAVLRCSVRSYSLQPDGL